LQDAWIGWAPTGIDGGTVVYIDAGLLYIPISRHVLVYTTNFVTADLQTDGFRLPNSSFPAFRDLGVQVRGWAFDRGSLSRRRLRGIHAVRSGGGNVRDWRGGLHHAEPEPGVRRFRQTST